MQMAVAAARDYLQSNGVRVSEATIAALTEEMFRETASPETLPSSARRSAR